ncbi:MAG: hypothetical protein AB7N80_15425, partial [Bdellovibrionales bacterium]
KILEAMRGDRSDHAVALRLQILTHLNEKDDSFLGVALSRSLEVYRNILQAERGHDMSAIRLILYDQIKRFSNWNSIKVFISALVENPEYLEEDMVKRLYDKNAAYADSGYMLELLQLIALLPAQTRAPYLAGALHYLNRYHTQAIDFGQPIFNSQRFVELLVQGLKSSHTAADARDIREKILSRPEFQNHTDLMCDEALQD